MKKEKNESLKRCLKVLLLSCFIVAMVGCKPTEVKKVVESIEKIKNNAELSAWVWDSKEVASNDSLKVAKKLSIDTLYINTGWNESTSEFFLKKHEHLYMTYIRKAFYQNLNVEALLSNNDWTLAENYDDMENQVNEVLKFNKKYRIGFEAIHFNVKPYLLNDWDTYGARYLTSYIINLSKIKKVVEQHNKETRDDLKIVVDVPWWYAYEYTDKNTIAMQELLKVSDELVVENFTTNKSDFTSRFIDTLQFADNEENKQVSMAVMLVDSEKEVDSLAYMNVNDLVEFLNDGIVEFSKYESFKGIAILDYDGFNGYANKFLETYK